jgi:membrane protease YdiL (CAAX protease family)
MQDWRNRALALLKALAFIAVSWVAVGFCLSFNTLAAGQDGRQVIVSDEAIIALVTLGLSWAFLRAEGLPLTQLGLDLTPRWLRQFGAGTLLGGGIILAAALASAILAGVRWRVGTPGLATLASGVGTYVAVAWAEELHYRGYPFQRLCGALGPWLAQAAFAAYFVHSHWQNPGMEGTTRLWAALNIGLASLLLGFAWLRSGSLALSLGIHFGWNFVQGPLLGFGVSGTQSAAVLKPVLPATGTWLHGGGFGLEAGLACAVSCLAGWFLLDRVLRLENKGEPCRAGS